MCRKFTYLACFVLVLVLFSNVSAGLVAHWEFDDGSGTNAVDSSGNGHDGTLQGDPQWVDGMIGSGALSFDGSDGLVDVGHDESLSMTDDLTITVWVKVSDLSTFYFLVCKQPSGTAGDNYPGNYEFRTESNTGALLSDIRKQKASSTPSTPPRRLLLPSNGTMLRYLLRREG